MLEESKSRRTKPKYDFTELYLGKVESNVDPLARGRVKVRVPIIHGAKKSGAGNYIDTSGLPWASPCYDYNQDYAVPEEGSLVYVLFLQGDIDNPIYIGVTPYASNPGDFSFSDGKGSDSSIPKEAKQSLDVSGKVPQVRVIKSKGGHHIVLDDAQKFLLIKSANGHIIELDDQGNNVLIHSEGNCNVTVQGNCNITVHGATAVNSTGNVDVTAPNVKLHVSAGALSGNIVSDCTTNNDPITGIPLQGIPTIPAN